MKIEALIEESSMKEVVYRSPDGNMRTLVLRKDCDEYGAYSYAKEGEENTYLTVNNLPTLEHCLKQLTWTVTVWSETGWYYGLDPRLQPIDEHIRQNETFLLDLQNFQESKSKSITVATPVLVNRKMLHGVFQLSRSDEFPNAIIWKNSETKEPANVVELRAILRHYLDQTQPWCVAANGGERLMNHYPLSGERLDAITIRGRAGCKEGESRVYSVSREELPKEDFRTLPSMLRLLMADQVEGEQIGYDRGEIGYDYKDGFFNVTEIGENYRKFTLERYKDEENKKDRFFNIVFWPKDF